MTQQDDRPDGQPDAAGDTDLTEQLQAVADDLNAIEGTDLSEQPAAFERIHRRLVAALETTAEGHVS